jgi:excisionase family DNA binding protein
MTAEVTVAKPAYWVGQAPQLAQALRTAAERATRIIGDPTGQPPDAENLFVVVNPGYWASQLPELADALVPSKPPVQATPAPGHRPGATGKTVERLTLTVEEAALALGISRASAYEAVRVGEIPSIRIGKRILVPKSALDRMLEHAGEPDEKDQRKPKR